MSQLTLCVAFLCTANAAFAVRKSAPAAPHVLPLADLERQCPLKRDASDPKILRRRGAEASAEGSSCCSGGGVLYNCDAFDFTVGDEVRWTESDEDVPAGSVGLVSKLEPPDAVVKFGDRAFTLDVADVRRVGATAAAEDSSNRWSCSCPCEDVERNLDIVRYAVEEQDGRHFRVWADLEPRAWEDPDQGRVLFLYPMSDSNNAFAFHEQLCERIACWQKRGFAVSLRAVGNISAAHKVLERFSSKSLSHVVLGGHGNPRGITWGKGDEGKLKAGDSATEKFLFALRNKLLVSGSVILDACETAKYLGELPSFFEFVASKLPGRRIVGATVKLKQSMWKQSPDSNCITGDTVIFEEEGDVKMRVQKRGKPNCKEMSVAEIQASAKAGGMCLSRCGTTCGMAWFELWRKGKLGDLSVSLDREPVQDAGVNPCNYGWKTLCRMGVRK